MHSNNARFAKKLFSQLKFWALVDQVKFESKVAAHRKNYSHSVDCNYDDDVYNYAVNAIFLAISGINISVLCPPALV